VGRKPAEEEPAGQPRVSSPDPLVLGEGEGAYHEARCPVCEAPKAVLRTVRLDVPYFGEVFETVFMCRSCGFRHADTMLSKRGSPAEYSLKVVDDGDLFVRAVKSSSATVVVPELGLLWEPGPASTAEVTNAEGLLRRFEDAVRRAMTLFEGEETQARGRQLLRQIDAVIAGRKVVTLVLKDPYGNSALLDDRGRVVRRDLSVKEAAELMTGEYVFDMGEGRPTGLRKVAKKGGG
jgi:zinc finger protein